MCLSLKCHLVENQHFKNDIMVPCKSTEKKKGGFQAMHVFCCGVYKELLQISIWPLYYSVAAPQNPFAGFPYLESRVLAEMMQSLCHFPCYFFTLFVDNLHTSNSDAL